MTLEDNIKAKLGALLFANGVLETENAGLKEEIVALAEELEKLKARKSKNG